MGRHLAKGRAQVPKRFSGASRLDCEAKLAARNRSRSVPAGDSPFEESLRRKAETAHEIAEGRIGANRIESWLHLEPCQVYITVRVGCFQPSKCLLFLSQGKINLRE